MALDNPNSGNNSGNIGDLSELVGAITALNTNNRKILEVLESIDKNNISRDDFRNLIRDVNRNNSSSNTNNNNSNSSRSRNRDYEPRIDLSRDRRYQNEMTQNLERSNRIIQDFSRIINNTNASFNNLDRILDESNRKINRNLETIGNLDFTRATQGLQHSLDSFIRGTSDELNSSLSSLRRFQDNLNNRIRNENNDLIRSSRERLGQFNTQSNKIQSDLVSLDRNDLRLNIENSDLTAELGSLTDRISVMSEEMTSLFEAERIAQIDERNAIEDALNALTIQHNRGEIDDVAWIVESARLNDKEQDRLNRVQNIIQQQQQLLDEHAENERRQQEIIDRQSQIPNELAQNAEDRNKLNADSERLNENARRYEQSLVERAELERQAEEVLNRSLGRTQDRLRDITEAVDTQAQLLDTSRDLRRGAGIIPTEFSNISDILANAFGFNTEDQEEQKLKPFEELIESYNRALADNQQKIEQLNQEYIANQERIAEINDVNNGRLVNTQEDIKNTNEKLSILQTQLAQASEDDKQKIQEEIDNVKIQRDNLLLQEQNLKNEAELLKAENDNIEANREQLTENENLLNRNKQNAEQMLDSAKKNLGLFPQLINKALTGAGKLIKKGISEVEDYIKQAANEVFDSFERLQQSVGKTLKMNSGAYEEFKEQMIAAADEAGLAIDVTKLNDAAANMAELGVRDTELLKDFAVASSVLSETGSHLKLNEDTTKQLIAGYQESIRSGQMTQEEASDALLEQFYEIAAAEKLIADNYGSTMALYSGQNTIQDLFSRLTEAGYLESTDFGKFYANMGNLMQAMESAGMDSGTLISDFESILNGNMSSLNTELKGWFQTNEFATTDDFLKAIATDFGSVAQSFESFRTSLYQNMDEQAVSYARQAFGSNLTNLQVVGRQNRTDDFTELLADSNKNLTSSVDDIKEGLKNAEWQTATDRMRERAINFVDNMASEFQDLPDGKVIMNEGFAVVTERLNSIIDGIGNILTALLTGNLINNPLNPAGGGGGIAGSQLGSFLIGGSGTAGTAGKIVGSVAGVGVAGYSLATNLRDAETISEGIENTLTDTQFYSGVGMALGGAIAGPLGSAVGGAVGGIASTLGNKLANIVTKGIDEELAQQDEVNQRLQVAAESLLEAGNLHKQNAENTKQEINSQKEIFESFDTNQQKQWLQQHSNFLWQEGILSKSETVETSKADTNEMFEKAVNRWMEIEELKYLKESALGQADLFTNDIVTASNTQQYTQEEILNAANPADMYNNLTNLVETYTMNHKEQQDKLIDLMNIDTTGKSTEDAYNEALAAFKDSTFIGTDKWLDIVNYFNEYATDLRAVTSDTNLDDKITTIEQYQKALNIEDFKTAATEYYKEIGEFTDEEAQYMADLLSNRFDADERLVDDQELFRKQWNNLVKVNKDKGLSNQELINLYTETYKDTDAFISPENMFNVNATNTELNTNTNAVKWLQESGSTYAKLEDLPKYATGLEYVPYDDFPALLHEGETVLDPENAEAYRSLIDNLSNVDTTGTEGISLATLLDSYNNSYNTTSSETYGSILDTTPITTSVDKQTNIVVDLLTKILNILTTNVSTANKSYLPKSLIQYDSNLNRL